MAWQDRAYNRDEHGNVPPVTFSLPKITPLTLIIMAVCLVLFFIQVSSRGTLERIGALDFTGSAGFREPWRFITYQYLHGSGRHIFFNLIGLYFFLPSLERMWGWKKAFAFYTIGGIVSGITFGMMCLVTGITPPLIGASGSIFAAMGAVALLQPHVQLILLIFPVPIRIAVALFGGLFLLTVISDHDFSDAAHLGGLVFGFFAPWLAGPIWRKQMHQFERRTARKESRREIDEQAQIDAILAKVSAQGMHSLNWLEKRTLHKATERQRLRESSRRY